MTVLSKREFAERYMDVLQNLESFSSSCYQDNQTALYDNDVLGVYQVLLKYVKARLTNYPLPANNLKGLSLNLYEEMLEVVKFHENSYSLLEIQECLKMLEKSLKLWTRERGSQGYLKFISQFV